jgi:hypothetical protein
MVRRRTTRRRGGAAFLTQSPLTPAAPGGFSAFLPTTNWGRWSDTPQSYQWAPHTGAPAPLANGGLYTNPQSTAPWASAPFPATQYALAVEAAKVSGLPEVAYHQRPNDNFGASYSPITGSPITANHWSASGPAGPFVGGRRSRRSRKTRRTRRNRRRL